MNQIQFIRATEKHIPLFIENREAFYQNIGECRMKKRF